MALCSVADVRVYFSPSELSDADISAIIDVVSEEIAAKTGASASSQDTNLKMAAIHGAAAVTLKRARSNGELASSVQTPEYQQQNTGIIEEIRSHEKDRDMFIQRYQAATYGILYSRVGVGTIDAELR